MRDIKTQSSQGRKIIERSKSIDLVAAELEQIMKSYDETSRSCGPQLALYELITDVYQTGISIGYRYAQGEARARFLLNTRGRNYRFQPVRKWKSLAVIVGNLPEEISSISIPWGKPGKYRIFINRRLPDGKRLEAFVREMVHLYLGDHEKG